MCSYIPHSTCTRVGCKGYPTAFGLIVRNLYIPSRAIGKFSSQGSVDHHKRIASILYLHLSCSLCRTCSLARSHMGSFVRENICTSLLIHPGHYLPMPRSKLDTTSSDLHDGSSVSYNFPSPSHSINPPARRPQLYPDSENSGRHFDLSCSIILGTFPVCACRRESCEGTGTIGFLGKG